jgi:astacin
MEEIERKSCIRFKERDDEDDYIVIRHGSGCFSSVGRKGGSQTVSLGRGCANFGIILHELMHVIGFYHLHQRHDRDKYLEIHWENINPRFINNFKLLGPEYISLDEKFDYDSVMMYGETSFSRDGRSVTMTPTYNGVTILDPAYKTHLSDIDVRSINKMYRCGKYDNYVDYD